MYTDIEKRLVYAKVMRRFAPVLLGAHIIAFLDRIDIGYAKLEMSSAIGLSDAAFALGASVFFWGYTIFEVPSNIAPQKAGARRWLARIMVTWGTFSGLVLLSNQSL